MKRSLLLAAGLLAAAGAAFAQGEGQPAFRNTSLPMERRLSDLVHRLTLEEKAAQLNHLNTGIPRLGVAMWGGWNQTLHGVWSK